MNSGDIDFMHNTTDLFKQIQTLQAELSEEKITRKKAESKLNTILNSVVDAIVSIDTTGKVISYNKAAVQIFGFTHEEIIGNNVCLLMPEDFRPKHEAGLKRYNKTKKAKLIGSCVEVKGQHKSGKIIPIELTIGEICEGTDRHYIGVIRDISERKEAEQRIKYMALHDQLTGLPNRNMLNAHLEHALNRAKRGNHDLAVMYIDLDHFKPVNDNFGHAAGDIVLKKISDRFKTLVRVTDLVARVGGDEFITILEIINGKENAVMLAERFLSAANEPLNFDGDEFSVGASIGIAIYPDDGHTNETLLLSADKAMYAAKEKGRNIYQFAK